MQNKIVRASIINVVAPSFCFYIEKKNMLHEVIQKIISDFWIRKKQCFDAAQE